MAMMVLLLLLVVTGTGCLAAPFSIVQVGKQSNKLEKRLNGRIDEITATTTRLGNQVKNMKASMEHLENRIKDLEKQVKGKGGLKSQGPGQGRGGDRPPSRQNPRPPPARAPQRSGSERRGQPPSRGRDAGPGSRGGRMDMWGPMDEPPPESGPSGITGIFSKFASLFG